MNTIYKQPMENFNTYNKNLTTLEHARGKQCVPAPQPGRPNMDNSSGQGPDHMEI